MIQTIAVCKNYLVCRKSVCNTVPLKGRQDGSSLLEQVGLLYPEVLTVHGNNPWEGGALHRLDHDTTGLVLFARNQDFFNHMLAEQECDRFVKKYRAVCNSMPSASFSEVCHVPFHKTVSTYFRAFGPGRKLVKAESDIRKSDNKRLYTTDVTLVEKTGDRFVFECVITRGFRHQIRVHLARLGFPIVGDRLYNPGYICACTPPSSSGCSCACTPPSSSECSCACTPPSSSGCSSACVSVSDSVSESLQLDCIGFSFTDLDGSLCSF